MKLIVDLSSNKLKSIYQEDKIVDERKNCYYIKLDDGFNARKKIKKGKWGQLRDENNNLLWDEESALKPLMGYVMTDEEVEIDIFSNLDFWSIEEILKLKYENKLKNQEKYSHIYYQEFIDEDQIKTDGIINLGKRVCFGKGKITHDLVLKNGKIYFECDYEKEMPKMEISLDGKKFAKVTENPYIHDFRKSNYSGIYLKIDDMKNFLKSYFICFNGDKMKESPNVLQK